MLEEITELIGSKGKFNKPFDAWLYRRNADEQTGDSSDYGQWVGLYGRRIMREDTQGFVEVWRYETVGEARAAFMAEDEAYSVWSDAEMVENGPRAYDANGNDVTEKLDAFLKRNA